MNFPSPLVLLSCVCLAFSAAAQPVVQNAPPPNMTNTPAKLEETCSIQAGLPTPQQRRMGANAGRPSAIQQTIYDDCLRDNGLKDTPPNLNQPPPVDPPSSEVRLQQILASCSVAVGASNPTYVKPAQKPAFDYCLWRNGVQSESRDVNIR